MVTGIAIAAASVGGVLVGRLLRFALVSRPPRLGVALAHAGPAPAVVALAFVPEDARRELPGLANEHLAMWLADHPHEFSIILTQEAIIWALRDLGSERGYEPNRGGDPSLAGHLFGVPVYRMHVHDPRAYVPGLEALWCALARFRPVPADVVLVAHDKQYDRAFHDLKKLYKGRIVNPGIADVPYGTDSPWLRFRWAFRELYAARPRDFILRRLWKCPPHVVLPPLPPDGAVEKATASTAAVTGPQGRIEAGATRPFLLGVNYWPRRKAMYWWSDFDADEVRQEFDDIRAMGFGLVRLFLLWDAFQPAADGVNDRALRHLSTVCDIAAASGLSLDVTFFTGHMSGPNWVPEWLLRPRTPVPPGVMQVVTGGRVTDSGYANPFADAIAVRRAEDLLRAVVRAVGIHPAIAFWNLGNEPDLFGPGTDAASWHDWVRRMTGVIRDMDPAHPITCGLQASSLVEDNGFRIHETFAGLDFAAMHAYPMYADWAAGPLDEEFVPFTCALTAALAGKPVLMEEFGGCTESPGHPSAQWEWNAYGRSRRQFMASEEEFAVYVDRVLHRLVALGVMGAVLWCYADYAPQLWDRPPCDQAWHERRFGLVRPDGSWKPHARTIQQFASSRPAIIQPAVPAVTLDVTPEEFYRDPDAHARRLYQQFRSS